MSPSSSGPIVADKTITSASNPIYTTLLECLKSKGIKEHQLFLISGSKTVGEVLTRFPKSARTLLLSTSMLEDPKMASEIAPLIQLAKSIRGPQGLSRPGEADSKLSVIALSKPLFEKLDISGTHAPILAARTPEVATADLSKTPNGLEVLCALGDPANLGALVRSAAAFGVSRLVLLQESASPFHPKAVRAASGTTFLMDFASGPSIRALPDQLAQKTAVGPIFALDMFGASVDSFEWPQDARLLIGEEGQGVPEPERFTALSIPMQNGVESLNATVAASVALFAAKTSRSRA